MVGKHFFLTLQGGEPVRLQGNQPGRSLAMAITQEYHVVHAPTDADRGPYKVATDQYWYSLEEVDGPEIILYHYHPLDRSGIEFPHMHMKSGLGTVDLTSAHFPTGRVSVEAFLRLIITTFGVRPRSGFERRWEAIIQETFAAYDRYRTW